jgi:hypothetical protein
MNAPVSLSFAFDQLSGLGLRLLKQAGVSIVHLNECNWSEENPILFFQSNERSLNEIVDRYPSFRVIFTDHSHLAKFLNLELMEEQASVFLSDEYLLGKQISINSNVFSIDLQLPHEQLGHHRDMKGSIICGSGIIDLDFGKFRVVSFPWDLSKPPEQIAERNSSVVYRLEQGLEIEELGSVLDFTSLRMLMLDVLKKAILREDLPFVHVSYRTEQDYLCFRVDADGFSRESTRTCVDISINTGYPFTWFINVNDWLGNLSELKMLVENSQEVQSHGFFHIIFHSYLSNLLNFGLAKLLMRFYGIKATGSSSPLGLWNRQYLKAQRLLRVSYSSEFATGVEDIPFYPFNNERNPLQIPSNNISVGLFESLSSSPLIEVWEQSVWRQIADKGVAVIYDHPFQRLEEIDAEVTEFLLAFKRMGVKGLTLGQYHQMWLRRPVLAEAKICDGEVTYKFEAGKDSQEHFHLRICTPSMNSAEIMDPQSTRFIPQIAKISSGKYQELQSLSFFRFVMIKVREQMMSWRSQ